jgi:hypothetical protein
MLVLESLFPPGLLWVLARSIPKLPRHLTKLCQLSFPFLGKPIIHVGLLIITMVLSRVRFLLMTSYARRGSQLDFKLPSFIPALLIDD